jgi:dolichyl-phosphate-mannose-protein mannosyltransferase
VNQIKFALKITKKDLITMVLLPIIFLGIASWNVGEVNSPVTNWQSTIPQSFYISLDSNQQVQTLYFWVQSGNATVDVYSGSPGNWSHLSQVSLQSRDTDYATQQSLSVNVNTQYLDFNVTPADFDSRPDFYWSIPNPSDREPSPFIEVSEIGLESQSNHQIPITGIIGENNTDPTLTKLVDEQSSLQIPPTYMSKMYFDEVYFARSAIQLVNHQIPIERTHPPLGKLIQAVGVAAIGATPFGWRIMGVLFGTLIVALMYLLGKKLFGTWIGGFSAAFLMTFDFMHFTMARIGTADTYVVFFSLISQIFFLVYFMNVIKDGWKKTSVLPLFLAVIFFALGFSTKWFTIFSAAGLLALLIAFRLKDVAKLKGSLGDKYVAFFEHPFLLLLGFIGVAIAIYFATYIPEMLAGDSFPTIVNLQFAMYSFHSGTVVDPASSPWWSWPFMFRLDGVNVPRWFDISYLPNNVVSTITVFGNPVVWWIGFGLMLVLTEKAIHGRELLTNLRSRISKSSVSERISIRASGWDIPAIFIVAVFFFSWLPYLFIGRATYIYHFYLSVPLLCLAISYFINKYWNTRIGKLATIAIFAGTVGIFGLFYPVISGAPIDSSYIHDYLKWFPSWFFAP